MKFKTIKQYFYTTSNILGGSRLTLSSATEGDAGMYECVAVNTAGNSSKSFQLDVYCE